jgi:hypothetical protein
LKKEAVGGFVVELGHYVLFVVLILSVLWGGKFLTPQHLDGADFSHSELRYVSVGEVVSDKEASKDLRDSAGVTMNVYLRNTGLSSSVDTYRASVEFPSGKSVTGVIVNNAGLMGDDKEKPRMQVKMNLESPSPMVAQGQTIEGRVPVVFKGLPRDQVQRVGNKLVFEFKDTYGKQYKLIEEVKR